MAERKKQHFIPQFYLRGFSNYPEKKRIDLFNLSNGQVYRGASIRNQANAPYFYGPNLKMERALEILEQRAAPIVADIISRNRLPVPETDAHEALITFLLVLHARTLHMAELNKEISASLLKAISSRARSVGGKFDPRSIKSGNPAEDSVLNAAPLVPFLLDLDCKLLINETPVPFLASDNPVILYNRLCELNDWGGTNTGFARKGLMILLPLSPRHQLILFDRDVYRVYGMLLKQVPLKRPDDVEWLNGLQFLNANETLYFRGGPSEEQLVVLCDRFRAARRSSRATVREFAENDSRGKPTSFVFSFGSQEIRCGLSLSFVTLEKEIMSYSPDTMTTLYRNQSLVELHREFMNHVRYNRLSPMDFRDYIIRRAGRDKSS
jgi:hypothetical protein